MGKIYLGKSVKSFDIGDKLQPYVGVVVNAGEYTDEDGNRQIRQYFAGDTSGATGRVLELNCSWGTQQIANDVLASITGYEYQPFSADGANVEPTAEIGDAVSIGDVVCGISIENTNFSRMMASDISSPFDEEVEHEYEYQTPTDRAFARATRQVSEVRSSILATIDGLEASVVKQEGGNTESFSWHLKSDKFELKSGSNVVFKCDANGISINGSGTFSGEIRADSGVIGGFNIGATALKNSKLTRLDGNEGIYVGTDGIGLGITEMNPNGTIHDVAFTVDKTGKMIVKDLMVTGSLTFADNFDSGVGTSGRRDFTHAGSGAGYGAYSGGVYGNTSYVRQGTRQCFRGDIDAYSIWYWEGSYWNIVRPVDVLAADGVTYRTVLGLA